MALTPEQKELNKKAVSLRNKAYSERSRAYQNAMDEAERAAKGTDAHQAWKEAVDQIEQVINEKHAQTDAIRAKIRALEQEICDLNDDYAQKIEAIRKARDQKSKEYFNIRNALEDEVKARFPDMGGLVSAAGWKPIEEFIEQARQDDEQSAKPKRPRP